MVDSKCCRCALVMFSMVSSIGGVQYVDSGRKGQLRDGESKFAQGRRKALSDDDTATLVTILKAAEDVERQECTGVKQGSDGSVEQCDPPAAKIRRKIERRRSLHEGGSSPLVLRDRQKILESFSILSMSMTPEAADETTEITTRVLSTVYECPDTQEQTPTELQNKTVQGDMVFPTREAAMAFKRGGLNASWYPTFWQDDDSVDGKPSVTTIPFCFHADIAATSKFSFLNALQHYKNYIPCIDFREVAFQDGACAQKPAILVGSLHNGCWSYVGMATWTSAMTELNLQPNGCDTMGTAAHELGHALGMVHEQSRSDRDQYVDVLEENIIENRKNDYAIFPAADTSLPYDYKSLMHYGDGDFAKVGLKTMVAKQGFSGMMGNRMGLTQTDARQVANTYHCDAENFTACTTDPTGCTIAQCTCHPNEDEKYPYIKQVEGECQRCLRQCPNYPWGSPYFCACPLGCTFSSFVQNGETFRYCKNCKTPNPVSEAHTPDPTPAPTQAPTSSPTVAPTGEPTSSATNVVKPDGNANCKWYKDWCEIDEWVTRTCGTTCADDKEGCVDGDDAKCRSWGDYCAPGWYIHSKPVSEFCKVTCGTCGTGAGNL